MEIVLAIIIGVLYAAGVYMLLRRSLFKLIIGLVFFSHATNLLIFVSAGLTRAAPPVIDPVSMQAPGIVADPLPQALVLTAIVISFGITAFTLVLLYRFFKTTGTVDLDEIKEGY